MPAHPAHTRPLVVANARRSSSYGSALRLDWARVAGLLGHAGSVRTFYRHPAIPLSTSLTAAHKAG